MANYPNTIPATHRKSEFRAECYRKGWNHGHGLACHNVPQIGETYRTDSDGKLTADSDNVREIHSILCHEAESFARCYSPWEYIARDINESRNPDGGWQAYDDGVNDSIAADLATYTDSDYGLDDVDEESVIDECEFDD